MSDERDGYQAYLLRLWRVPSQGRWQWRASIESRRTGERQVFGSLEQLFAFLSERCEGEADNLRRGDAEKGGHGDGEIPRIRTGQARGWGDVERDAPGGFEI